MNKNELYNMALNRAMKLCSIRECCIKDINEKVSSWGIDSNDAIRIIDSLIKEKFIDEKRYASAFVKDKFNYNKWGKFKISSALKMKGIQPEVIRQSLDFIDDEKYRQMATKLLAAQRNKVKAKNKYDLKGKLLRYGLSKGFESGLLYELLGEDED
ncbi:MAG TPA: regulatory protein RecX [Bacteroidales bacterium]|nr:regulatory protein RecX [Bacteroidales bacterium]